MSATTKSSFRALICGAEFEGTTEGLKHSLPVQTAGGGMTLGVHSVPVHCNGGASMLLHVDS